MILTALLSPSMLSVTFGVSVPDCFRLITLKPLATFAPTVMLFIALAAPAAIATLLLLPVIATVLSVEPACTPVAQVALAPVDASVASVPHSVSSLLSPVIVAVSLVSAAPSISAASMLVLPVAV